MPKTIAKTEELTPRQEAQRMEAAAKKAEYERLQARARAVPLRNAPPEPRKGMVRYVAGEESYTPDGRRRLPGEVFELKRDIEPSQTWCRFEEHDSQKES